MLNSLLRIVLCILCSFPVSLVLAEEMFFTNPGPGGGSDLWTVEVHPEDPDVFYLGGDIEGPFKTENGGVSYSRITSGIVGEGVSADVYAALDFALQPENPGVVYMTTWLGLYRSRDAGANWHRLYPKLLTNEAGDSLACVAVAPSDPKLILAGFGDTFENEEGKSAIIRSTDGGETFTLINQEDLGFQLTDTVVHRLVFDTNKANVVYLASGEGVRKSKDAGKTWTDASVGLPEGAIVHDMVGVEHEGTFVLYASLRTQAFEKFVKGGVYRSVDGGLNWQQITGNLPMIGGQSKLAFNYWRLAVHPDAPQTLYVATRGPGWAWDQMGLYKTENALVNLTNEVTWTYVFADAAFEETGWLTPQWWGEKHVDFLAIAPSDANKLIAGGNEVFISEDAGQTWTEAYSIKNGDATFTGRNLELMVAQDVALDPNDPQRWWIGYDDMGLWLTENGGQSFRNIDTHQAPEALQKTDAAIRVLPDDTDSATLYVARSSGEENLNNNWREGYIYKTENNGQDWTRLGIDGGRPDLILLPDATATPEERTLLACIYGDGIYKSTDSGDSWTTSDDGLSAFDKTHVWTLAYDPLDPDIVYAGINDANKDAVEADGGIYKSTDAGDSWQKLETATAPMGQVIDIALDTKGVLYAATTPIYNWTTDQVEDQSRLGGLYQSRDRGEKWQRILEQPRVDAVSVEPGDNATIVAVVSSYFNTSSSLNAGVYVSRDKGGSFTYESNGLTHTRSTFGKFLQTEEAPFVVGTSGGGIFVGRQQKTPTFRITGTISYQGDKTGPVIVQLFDDAELTSQFQQTVIDGKGTYLLDDIPAGTWYLQAFMDIDENGQQHEAEPVGTFSEPVVLETIFQGADILMKDSLDEEPPVITVSPQRVLVSVEAEPLTEQALLEGVTATDEVDGDLTEEVTYTGNVDTTTVAQYTVAYDVVDQAGNQAATVERVYLVVPKVSFATDNHTINEGDADRTLAVSVQLSHVAPFDIQVPFKMSEASTAGQKDLELSQSPLQIQAGQTFATISLEVQQDLVFEINEVAVLRLTIPKNARLGSDTAFELTIVDADSVPSFTTTAISVYEQEKDARVPVRLNGAHAQGASIEYEVVGDTALRNQDFTGDKTGALNWAPDESGEKYVVIPLIDDFEEEAEERLRVFLKNPKNAIISGDANLVYVTLLDTDFKTTVHENWNLVALPRVNVELSLSDGASISGPIWQWGNGAYSKVDAFRTDRGYWVFIRLKGGMENAILNVTGSLAVDQTLVLNEGWNLIGTIEKIPAPYDLTERSIWRWDASEQVYKAVTEEEKLEPGRGYWIYRSGSVGIQRGNTHE